MCFFGFFLCVRDLLFWASKKVGLLLSSSPPGRLSRHGRELLVVPATLGFGCGEISFAAPV